MNHAVRRVSFALTACLAIVLSLVPVQNISALSAADWKPGRIIDDSVFFNDNSMSVQQIQDFLNAKVPNCDRNHQSYFTMNGKYHQPPYTCLKEYNENPTTHENNIGRFNPDGSPVVVNGGKSAAQIILEAGQAHDINPQVLLVMLQKETAIVTDTWAATWQYDRAMGYACPDSGVNGSANCDTSYYGFYNQVTSAARQLRRYVTYPDNYNFKSGVTRNIQWDVPAACGSSPVYIETQATAALYNYTPYQPNAMALSNLSGGQDDGCSAYGNRNFWVYFNNWFGSTLMPFYSARVVAQSPYPTIASGTSQKATIRYINQGTQRWYDTMGAPSGVNPVHLAATSPINRTSHFSQSWPSGGRPNTTFTKVYEADGITLAINQHAVEPGQQAVWEFDLTVPVDYTPGRYRETFQPVLEHNSSWAMGGIAWLDITVKNPYVASPVSQSNYSYNASQNSKSIQTLRYRNDGEAYWYDTLTALSNKTKPFVLSTPGESKGALSAEWPSSNRASSTFSAVYLPNGSTLSPFQHVVRPGEIVEFAVPLTVLDDHNVGPYRQMLQPIVDGYKNGVKGGLIWFDLNISGRKGNATLVSQSSFPSIQSGSAKNIYLAYKNNTNSSWHDDTSVPKGLRPMHVATFSPINRTSTFSYDWFNRARPSLTFAKVTETDGVTLAPNQHVAEPGQVAFFSFNLTAPWTYSGDYREYFLPILEGSANWYQGGVSWMDVKVTR